MVCSFAPRSASWVPAFCPCFFQTPPRDDAFALLCGAARAAPPYHRASYRLLVRDTGDQGVHLRRSNTSRLIISPRGWEETVVAALPCSCDVVEISVIPDVIQQVEKRVRITRAAMPEAIAVGNDRRPEGR